MADPLEGPVCLVAGAVKVATLGRKHRAAMEEAGQRGLSAEACATFESLMGTIRGMQAHIVMRDMESAGRDPLREWRDQQRAGLKKVHPGAK
jgi:hypothetical protein